MMQHWATLLILLLVALPGAPAFASDEPENPGDVEAELWKQLVAIDERSRQITSFEADYVERKKSLLLKKPLVSTGTVIARSPIVRWDMKTPYTQTTLVAPGSVRVYMPDEKLLEIYDLGDRLGDISSSPVPSLARTAELFRIAREQPPAQAPDEADSERAADKADDDATDDDTLTLRLTPREEKLREHIEGVVVTIDVQGGFARRMIMLQKSGESADIRFSQVKINHELDASRLELTLPDDVETVRPLEDQEEGS